MQHAPLARHLARFPAAFAATAVALPPPAPPVEAAPAEPQVSLTASELEARLGAAHRDGAERAQAEAGRALAALRAEHDAAVAGAASAAAAAARAECVAFAAEHVAGQIDAAFAAVVATLGAGLADALRPLVASALVERAVAELAAALDKLLADPDHPPVVVRGPADLLAALDAARGGRRGLELVPADGGELVVTAAGAHLETRLAGAFATLAAAEAS